MKQPTCGVIARIKIKIITTKGCTDKNPTVNWILPDEKLVRYSEFANVEMQDLTLLHEDDIHFNLVISKESDLAKIGSLSYRFNIGPMLEGNGSVKKAESNIEDAMDIVTDSETQGFDEMKKKLKESEEGKKVLMTEYLKCERELRMKTEENGKLKTEIKYLKEIMKLKEQLKENNLESPISDDIVVEGNIG